MLKAIFNWFTNRNPHPNALAPATTNDAAPYKIESPQPITPITSATPVGDWPFPNSTVPATATKETKKKTTVKSKKAPAKAKTESKPAAITATKKPRAKKSS